MLTSEEAQKSKNQIRQKGGRIKGTNGTRLGIYAEPS